MKPGLPPLAAMRPDAARRKGSLEAWTSLTLRGTRKGAEEPQRSQRLSVLGNRRLRRLEPIRGRLPPAGLPKWVEITKL